MRKMNSADIKNDFTQSLAALNSFYSTTSAALTLESQITFLTENTLMAAAVLWEGFISDLLIAYINRDSTRFATHLKDALETGLSDKQKTILTKYTALNVPKHLKKAEILSLVDTNGNNITFSHFDELVTQAKSWLATVDADRFKNRTAREKAIVNSLIALRNHLAHRSDRSHEAMNVALSKGGLHATGLQRARKKVNNVGTYLKSIAPKKNVTRLEIFLSELQSIAVAL